MTDCKRKALFFLLGVAGARSVRAWPRLGGDTAGEEVSRQRLLPPPLLPSLHLGFHVLSSLSVFCGRWYVDFIKFSSGVGDSGGGWRGRGMGGGGCRPLSAAFIRPASLVLEGRRVTGVSGSRQRNRCPPSSGAPPSSVFPLPPPPSPPPARPRGRRLAVLECRSGSASGKKKIKKQKLPRPTSQDAAVASSEAFSSAEM